MIEPLGRTIGCTIVAEDDRALAIRLRSEIGAFCGLGRFRAKSMQGLGVRKYHQVGNHITLGTAHTRTVL